MNVYKKALELDQQNKPYVIATVISSEGSVPGKPGFKILVEDEKTTTGTVGGGAIEKQVIEQSLALIKEGGSCVKEYLLSDKAVQESVPEEVVPMMCNGKVTIFYESYGRKENVYIFGGGHVGQALLYYLKPLNFYTVLIDNRAEFANKEINPLADECILKDYIEFAEKSNIAAGSYIIIVTHGHKFDNDILRIMYRRKLNLRYIGVISSKSKAERLINGVRDEFPDADLSILHSPIGLNIGGDSAAEIALSIAAELQAVKYKKVVDI